MMMARAPMKGGDTMGIIATALRNFLRGTFARATAKAKAKPTNVPASAVSALILRLFQNAFRK